LLRRDDKVYGGVGLGNTLMAKGAGTGRIPVPTPSSGHRTREGPRRLQDRGDRLGSVEYLSWRNALLQLFHRQLERVSLFARLFLHERFLTFGQIDPHLFVSSSH